MMKTDSPQMRVTPFRAHRFVSTSVNKAGDETTSWAPQMEAIATHRDRDCFMQIYDHFSPRLQRYLMGLGVRPGLAEELVQEALLRLWRKAAQFNPERASLSTWLFRIARNLYIDHVRREPDWQPIQDGLEQLERERPKAQRSETEAFAEHEELKKAILELPAMQARLIRMSYFEAKSHREISEELSMPLGSVKSRLRKAFGTLSLNVRRES
ncbi:sigma-70 family RNA polymerase sigma factor [Oleiagrimonas sp.]|jgi:RNA polymerase sigma-70 factor (ECF subfamily)|uniref:sigma-70 family RNA polymerase sigma factor n=1 Tax=Oleiagrimonas sp. TaxID=2010330 RepID=UPI002630DF19|nr:sigma-70 family RNA polymerase sigma factor [Oleiagrimonas sp.]MDA3914346.1 sigma-70 family RNA polymerase sigma factor [Oleiagrimonas sp.]